MPRHPTLLPLLMTLMFAVPCAHASNVYQWKDAQGGMHFTDTPPPAGAVLIKSPKPKPGSAPATVPVPLPSPEPAPAPKPVLSAEEQARMAELEARVAKAKARHCEDLALGAEAGRRVLDGRSTEIMSPEERASLPAQIADMEARRLRDCPSP